MSHHTTATPGVIQPSRNTKTGPRLERGVTTEVVVMWAAYLLTVLGNALIEGGQLAGTTSATIAYAVFTWFTPAGYVFSIWSLIYVALIVWLVSYTRAAPTRRHGMNAVSVLFVASSVLNVVWLVLWHFNLVAVSFVVIVAEWAVLATLYLRVRKTATSAAGWVPLSLYTAWITVATLANMAILITRTLDGGVELFNGLSVILLTTGVLTLGYVMKTRYHDVVFPLVFLWAIIGVGVHVLEVSVFTAVVVFVLAAVGAVLTFTPVNKLLAAMRHPS